MKNSARWWMLAVVALLALGAAGCGGSKTESDSSATTSEQAAPQAAAPSGETDGHGGHGETITPAETVAGIWGQITEEQAKLSESIQNAQLKEVHHEAFGIRDLVVALAQKVSASSPAAGAKLDGLVDQVKTSAAKLDEMGDSGNLSGTQAEFDNLNKLLAEIKAVSGAQ